MCPFDQIKKYSNKPKKLGKQNWWDILITNPIVYRVVCAIYL